MKKVEKISLLSEMIALSRRDKTIKEVEYDFIKRVAIELDISPLDFNFLIKNPINYSHLEFFEERIIQFYKLVLLIKEDNRNVTKESDVFFNYGLEMGLNHETIRRVLDLTNTSLGNIIPSDLLIDIYRIQFN